MSQFSSPTIEMSVLGGAINRPEDTEIILKYINEKHLVEPSHKIIYKAIRDVFEKNGRIDLAVLNTHLKNNGTLDRTGGLPYLLTLSQSVTPSFYAEDCCKQLIEESTKRDVLNICSNLFTKSNQNADDIIEKALKQFIDLKEAHDAVSTSSFGHLLEKNSEAKVMEDLKKISEGVNTGYKIGNIDLVLPGGAISVVALPTGHGKTATKINLSLGALKRYRDLEVYFFSYEESNAAITTYFLNTYMGKVLSKNNRHSIQSYYREDTFNYIAGDSRDAFEADKKAFYRDLIDSGRLRIFYTDMSTEELVTSIRFIKKNNPKAGLICIDYIQCLRLARSFQGSRQEQLKEISLLLKDVAIETGLPILLGAQFNREVTCEADLSPTKIREAADIEHVSNLIIGGWNRSSVPFSREGNRSRTGGGVIAQEPTIYFEVLKGRNIGNGHNCVMDFDGNTGLLANRLVKTTYSESFSNKFIKTPQQENKFDQRTICTANEVRQKGKGSK